MAENTETPVVLEIKNLYVGYYKDLNIIQDVNIKVRYNQITTILGANGVGKSTLVRLLLDIDKPDSGRVRHGFDGLVGHEEPWPNGRRRRRRKHPALRRAHGLRRPSRGLLRRQGPDLTAQSYASH